jgi:hypothetical protein
VDVEAQVAAVGPVRVGKAAKVDAPNVHNALTISDPLESH